MQTNIQVPEGASKRTATCSPSQPSIACSRSAAIDIRLAFSHAVLQGQSRHNGSRCARSAPLTSGGSSPACRARAPRRRACLPASRRRSARADPRRPSPARDAPCRPSASSPGRSGSAGRRRAPRTACSGARATCPAGAAPGRSPPSRPSPRRPAFPGSARPTRGMIDLTRRRAERASRRRILDGGGARRSSSCRATSPATATACSACRSSARRSPSCTVGAASTRARTR